MADQATKVPAKAATILVHVPTPAGTRIGSAFAWSGRLLLTNAHVVHEIARGGEVSAEREGRTTRVLLVARSRNIDLALLCQPGGDMLNRLEVRVEPVRPAEPVIAAGPVTLSARSRTVVLRGQVWKTGQYDYRFGPGWIAQLPGVRLGFSGTAVLDRRGRLVGMLTAIGRGTSDVSAFAPARPNSNAATHVTQAFVLDTAAIQAEVTRMLAEARQAPAGSSGEVCPG